jgi:hypothetical protein
MPNVPSIPSGTRAAVDAFLERLRTPATVAPGTRGRLIFALDATASRKPLWDLACQLQGEMFKEVAAIGGLEVQLICYRGDECKASPWVSNAATLAELMGRIQCVIGYTQISRVLEHARQENVRRKVSALVFVGDAVEESPDHLCAQARLLGVPCFLFQEGDDPEVAEVFQEIARLTNGAYCRFDAGAADQLRDLLRAVATYAAGGWKALSASRNAGAVKLLQQQLK